MPRLRTRRGGKAPSASTSPPSSPVTKSSINPCSSPPLNITKKVLRSSTANLDTSPTARRSYKVIVSATYKRPTLRISGLSEDFLSTLQADSQLRDSIPADFPEHEDVEDSLPDDDEHSDHESSSEDAPFQVRAPSRGGKGGSRGRGRGRGRGGRGRAGRPTRLVITRKHFHEDLPSQSTSASAEQTSFDHVSVEEIPDASSKAPEPPKRNLTSNNDSLKAPSQDGDAHSSTAIGRSSETSLATPKVEQRGARRRGGLSRQNSGIPPSAVTEDADATPQEPVLEDLKDIDLYPPFLEKYKKPKATDECEDKADFILKTRFQPMTNPEAFIAALTKHAPTARSTEVLFAIASNAQRALKAWQDEYLVLDKRTAPQQHPPRKPATGGRVPIDPEIFEAQKQADLYNYAYDAKKGPHGQDPYIQRLGRDLGRQLRQRRKRDLLDSAAVSEDDGGDNEGGPRKRQRRAVQRFEGTATPEFGARGTRKRVLAQRDVEESATPEVETRPKRARLSGALLPQRITELQVESAANSSSESEKKTPEPPRRRGRPPGSKNFAKRSDAGIKKGPRKPNSGTAAPAVSTVSTPQALQPAASQPNPETLGQTAVMYVPPQPANSAPSHASRGLAPLSTILSDNAEAKPAPRAIEPSRPVAPLTPGPTTTIIQPKTVTPNGTLVKGTGTGAQPKTRAKSEKRSHSMTIWWAERKKKAAEEKAAEARLADMKRKIVAQTHAEAAALETQSQTPPYQQSSSESRTKRSHPPSVKRQTPTPSSRQSSLSRVLEFPPSTQQAPQQPQLSSGLTLPPLAPSGHSDPYRHGFGGPLPPPPPQHHPQLAPAGHYQHPGHYQHSGHHGMPMQDQHPQYMQHAHAPPSMQPLPPPPPPRTQPILAPAPHPSQNQGHQGFQPPPHLGVLPLPGLSIQPQPPSHHMGGVPSPYAPLFGSFAGRNPWGPGGGHKRT